MASDISIPDFSSICEWDLVRLIEFIGVRLEVRRGMFRYGSEKTIVVARATLRA